MGRALTRMWEGRDAYRILVGKSEGKLEHPGVDRRIVLKRIFEKWAGGMDWIIWLRIGTGDGLL